MAVSDEPAREKVRRIDVIEVIQIAADDSGSQTRPNQLRQQNVRQTTKTVAGKQLAADFDSRFAQFVDPAGERRMGNTQVLRELLAGNGNHHVLHEGV